MINKIIRNFIAKRMAGRSDDGIMITLKDPQKVTLAENIMAELLMRNGIDPRAITSEKELKLFLQQIENARIREIQNTGIRNVESAKVFDLEGKEIPKGSKIMGGKAVDDLPPPGSRGGDDDIAAPVMNVEDAPEGFIDFVRKTDPEGADKLQKVEDEIKAAIEAGNKRAAENLRKKKKKKDDDPEKKAYGGRIGLKGGADASQFDKSPSEQRSVDISPSGSVTLGSGPPEGPDDRASADQDMVQMLVRQGYTPKEINAITNPTVIDKVKRSRFNNPVTRGILRTGAYLYNPTFAGIDFRRAMQLKNLYDVTKDSITNPEITEEDMQFATGGRVGLKVGTGKRFLQRVFGKEKFEEMKTRDPEMYVGLLEVVDMYRKRDKEGLKMYLQKFLPHMDDAEIEDFIRGSDGTEGLVGELIRLGSGRDYAGKLEMIKRADEMKKLRDLEVTEDMLRKPNADGGIMRLGLKEGSGMTRRTFLKLLGGAMAIPIVGKILKPFKIGKTVTKVPIIKTDDVPGKPEWFDQLVNKVILEGDDVTKRFATKERQIVHAKQIDEDNYVTVTQDLDEGAVVVEYESPTTMFGEKVDLRYKKPPPDEGDPRPVGEFQTEESGIVGRAQGPDDYDLEIEGMSGRAIEDLESDVSILKQYATGKKPTLKEIVQSKKRKDKVKYYETPEGQSEYVVQRQGEADDYYTDVDDFASGGLARMLGE